MTDIQEAWFGPKKRRKKNWNISPRLDRARRRLREERERQARASGQALRQTKNPERQPVLKTEERREKVGGGVLDRALAQPCKWVCEWKAGKGRRALWAERCGCMDGMTVGAVAAGGRGDWLRQGVRVGCIQGGLGAGSN